MRISPIGRGTVNFVKKRVDRHSLKEIVRRKKEANRTHYETRFRLVSALWFHLLVCLSRLSTAENSAQRPAGHPATGVLNRLETCELRDPKVHYTKARAGLIPDFTGIGPPEPPENPSLRIMPGLSRSEAVRGWVVLIGF